MFECFYKLTPVNNILLLILGLLFQCKLHLQSILSIIQPGINAVKNQMNAPIVSEKSGVGVQIRCKRVTDKVKFQCEASDLYRALTEPEVCLVS